MGDGEASPVCRQHSNKLLVRDGGSQPDRSRADGIGKVLSLALQAAEWPILWGDRPRNLNRRQRWAQAPKFRRCKGVDSQEARKPPVSRAQQPSAAAPVARRRHRIDQQQRDIKATQPIHERWMIDQAAPQHHIWAPALDELENCVGGMSNGIGCGTGEHDTWPASVAL